MTYCEAVRYLTSLIGDVRAADFGLARMKRLLALLGEPQRAFRAVHVAGTNGKGSTAAFIAAGLRAAGRRAGLYTSPHLVCLNERIRLNGEDISDPDFARAVEEVRAANERIASDRGRAEHPTFFESVTAAACTAFRQAGVEWGVVEVGLGGRLDATNALTGEVGVVTPIDFDHERFLGKDLASIGAEKAGIFKPGMRAAVAPQHPEAMAAIEERAGRLEMILARVGIDWTAEKVTHARGCYGFEARRSAASRAGDDAGGAFPRVEVSLRLPGEHQVVNALTAVAALDLLHVEGEAAARGLSAAKWPGRLERIPGPPEILLDAAHNPAGARTLARFLEQHESGRKIHLIYGAVRDKAVDEMAGVLFPQADRVILTRSQATRSVRPQTLREVVDHHHAAISVAPDLREALDMARSRADDDDLIVIAGSIFLVGEAVAMMQAATAPE